MSSPAVTNGRAIIIFSISRLNNKSKAACMANEVLPEPDLPLIAITVLVSIAALACFCSGFNTIPNLIGVLGLLFSLILQLEHFLKILLS